MSEGFLGRWSRRKRGEAAAPSPEPAAERASAPAPAPEPEAEFDLSQLPSLDGLTAESDFSVFLRPGVPAAIRGAALRKAWVADPLIRDFVSSLDYGWDFNAPGGVPGFALELGETGERLRQLLAQAMGEREEAPAPAPTAPEGAEAPAPADPLALDPPPATLAEPERDAPLPARRHGGAMPA